MFAQVYRDHGIITITFHVYVCIQRLRERHGARGRHGRVLSRVGQAREQGRDNALPPALSALALRAKLVAVSWMTVLARHRDRL